MDSEYRKTITRNTGKDEAGNSTSEKIQYVSDPLPIDISVDMSLELMELASPVAGLAGDHDRAGQAFADTARAVLVKGGFKFGLKIFTLTKTRRNGRLLKDQSELSIAYDGKGGLQEFSNALVWVLKENFEDFFLDLLESFGQNSQETDNQSEATG